MSRREQIAGELTEQLEEARQERALIDGLIDWLEGAIEELVPTPSSVNGPAPTPEPEPRRVPSTTGNQTTLEMVQAAIRGLSEPASVKQIAELVPRHEMTVRTAVYELMEMGEVEEVGLIGPRSSMAYTAVIA